MLLVLDTVGVSQRGDRLLDTVPCCAGGRRQLARVQEAGWNVEANTAAMRVPKRGVGVTV